MGTISDLYDEVKSYLFDTPEDNLAIVYEGYLAKASIEGGQGEFKDIPVAEGDSIGKLAKQNNVTRKQLIEWNKDKVHSKKNKKWFNPGTIRCKCDYKVCFDKVKSASIGDELYFIVRTKNLEDKEIIFNLKQGKSKVLAEKDSIILVELLDEPKREYSVKVGISDEFSDALNKDEYKNIAIRKLKLTPNML